MSSDLLKFLLRLLLVLKATASVVGHFMGCRTPIGGMGTCISLKYCPEVLLLFQKLPRDQATKYSTVLKNICGNQVTYDEYPTVCCANPMFRQGSRVDYDLVPVVIEYEKPTTPQEPGSIETPTPTESPKIKSDQGLDKPCLDLKSEIGFCKPLANCAELLDAIRADPSNETVKNLLRDSHKKCDLSGTDVCCPVPTKPKTSPKNEFDYSPTLPPTEDQGCGRDHHIYMKKVIGGQESEIGAWPWIALLGYNPYSANPFRCGGTLITARHVLTAAHCILSDLSFVRLGEHDLSVEDESTYIDVNVAKAIRHEKYSKVQMTFDIGLVFLESSVNFTDVIYPACLPMSGEMRTKSFVAYEPYAAGWGRTSRESSLTSDALQEVQLLVHENHVCRDAFRLALKARGRQFPANMFDDSVLCVGDLGGKKDTCRGDSGGPLVISEAYKGTSRYYLIGVTSFGIGCARPGVPAIYSSTQYFMDWILEKLKAL